MMIKNSDGETKGGGQGGENCRMEGKRGGKCVPMPMPLCDKGNFFLSFAGAVKPGGGS